MDEILAHQEAGATRILELLKEHGAAILADVPGTGKTRTTLRALQRARARPLVICPAIVRTHWRREAAAIGYLASDPFPIKSYEEITRGGNALMVSLLRSGVNTLVIDEAHYLKHATSLRTLQILGRDGYARRLPTILLSGSFPPRNAAEMWTVLSSMFPRLMAQIGFRTYLRWEDVTCITRGRIVRGIWREKVVGNRPEALPLIHKILARVSLRRTLDDLGLDIPELFWQPMRLDAGELPDLADSETMARVQTATVGKTLAEIANDPQVARMRRHLGEFKVPLVLDRLHSELSSSDEKIAVFAYHTSVLRALKEGLAEYGVAFVDGNVVGTARQNEIDRFQSDPAVRIFIGQNIAVQTGVPLSAARRAVLVEPEWTPDTNYQLGKRIARIGSASGVCIAQMVCLADTLDEAIIAQNIRETRMVSEILQ